QAHASGGLHRAGCAQGLGMGQGAGHLPRGPKDAGLGLHDLSSPVEASPACGAGVRHPAARGHRDRLHPQGTLPGLLPGPVGGAPALRRGP
ncbi:hypothetical protein ABTE97_19280, partial [Acinetobacter baumannii]